LKLHKINEKLAYWKLSSKKEYLIEALSYLKFYISNYLYRLDSIDQKIIIIFYKNTCDKYKININILEKKANSFEEINLWNDNLSKKVSINQLSKNFEDFINYLWVEFKILENPDFINFSVTWTSVNIPTWKKFSELKIWIDMLRLMKHEIWTHVFTRNNTVKMIWEYLTMPYQNEREEWLATYNESLLFWINDKYSIPSYNLIRILMWEELYWKEFLKMLGIIEKLDKKTKWAKKRFYRYKRFFPRDLPWVLSRDISYNIWRIKIWRYLNKHRNTKSIIPFLSLYILRVSMDDLWLSSMYLKSYLQKNKIGLNKNKDILRFLKNKWFLFESFYVDALLYITKNNLVNLSWYQDKFISHLKDKYYFLPDDFFKFDIPLKEFKFKKDIMNIIWN
jgi:hypothetical protein